MKNSADKKCIKYIIKTNTHNRANIQMDCKNTRTHIQKNTKNILLNEFNNIYKIYCIQNI